MSIPPDLLTKVIREALETGEAYASSKISGVALQAGLTRSEIEPQLKQTEIGERRKELVADLAPLALQELGMNAQVSPCAAIGLMLGPWVMSSVSAYMALTKLAAEKLALEKSQGKPPPKP